MTYFASLPGIPNCTGRGQTKEEAHANLFDKLSATLQVKYEVEGEAQPGGDIFETLKNQHEANARMKETETQETLATIQRAR
jgi:predicted RNase H-like HicB family nuclease